MLPGKNVWSKSNVHVETCKVRSLNLGLGANQFWTLKHHSWKLHSFDWQFVETRGALFSRVSVSVSVGFRVSEFRFQLVALLHSWQLWGSFPTLFYTTLKDAKLTDYETNSKIRKRFLVFQCRISVIFLVHITLCTWCADFAGIFTLCWGLATHFFYRIYPVKTQFYFLLDTSHLVPETDDRSTASPLKLSEVWQQERGNTKKIRELKKKIQFLPSKTKFCWHCCSHLEWLTFCQNLTCYYFLPKILNFHFLISLFSGVAQEHTHTVWRLAGNSNFRRQRSENAKLYQLVPRCVPQMVWFLFWKIACHRENKKNTDGKTNGVLFFLQHRLNSASWLKSGVDVCFPREVRPVVQNQALMPEWPAHNSSQHFQKSRLFYSLGNRGFCETLHWWGSIPESEITDFDKHELVKGPGISDKNKDFCPSSFHFLWFFRGSPSSWTSALPVASATRPSCCTRRAPASPWRPLVPAEPETPPPAPEVATRGAPPTP